MPTFSNALSTWRYDALYENALLYRETAGLAVDWTATADFALQTWDMDAVEKRSGHVRHLSPHTFFTQSGTSAKYVKTSSTGIGWSPHNLLQRSQEMHTSSYWELGIPGVSV